MPGIVFLHGLGRRKERAVSSAHYEPNLHPKTKGNARSRALKKYRPVQACMITGEISDHNQKYSENTNIGGNWMYGKTH
ncbi:hypothetical protein [Bacillus velezensis]|uniref:hypothetical protein n=1 Tax=Bacillus velezensis TaxID=492670 RepID=UPI003C6C60FF